MSQPLPTLQYETATVQRQLVPAWVWTVVGVYGLLLTVVLTAPAWGMWLTDDTDVLWFLLAVVGVLTLCGLALIFTPVRLARRRPLTRRSYLIPLIVSGLLMGVLLTGAGFAMAELANDEGLLTLSLIAGGVVWLCWMLVWWRTTRTVDPTSVAVRLHRHLLAGSLAELLVAVPCHVIVRRRDECCAGMLTGTAICLGALIMFVAFGPSVLLLYLKRSRMIASS